MPYTGCGRVTRTGVQGTMACGKIRRCGMKVFRSVYEEIEFEHLRT